MDEEPSLEDILALGGTEDDLNLIRRGTTTGNDVTANEVNEFIQSIGLLPGEMMEEDEEEEEEEEAVQRHTEEKQMSRKKSKDKKNAVNKMKLGTQNETVTSANETEMKLTVDGELSSTPTPGGVVEMLLATQKMEKILLKINSEEHKKLLVSIDSETPWFEDAASELTDRIYSQTVLNHLYTTARQVMTTELKLYERVREKRRGRDVQWLKTVVSSGTLNDKMAALTLLIQESPVHTLSTVDNFLNMAVKKSKRESLLAIDTFKELWIADLLPEDRKLKSLQQRPLQQLVMSARRGKDSCDFRLLLIWYYEDQLKTKYARFIATLQKLLHDPVAEIREKILGVLFDLMYRKPEQEQLLLKLIVNKMGDPNRRIASKCILLLLKLLNHHVNMKLIVVRDVEALLHRPNLSQKAQYYAICFLNQVVISPTNQTLALKLINVYFSFFKVYTEKGDYDAKILGALLTGVNRALPFLKADIPSLEDHLNALFKIVHVGPLATGVQSLALLFQVMESRQAVSTRYYRALYQKLMDPQLSLRSAQQAMFLNLLFKSVKSDPELARVKAFLKRILQSSFHHLPHLICGCLVLISEILKLKTELWPFVLQAEAEDEEEFYDVEDEEPERDIELKEKSKNEDADMAEGKIVTGRDKYSMVHREPLYCGAESSCLWELVRLTHHFHPSVQVFAKTISTGNYISYDGDPLNDFTTMRFIDHFIHKNPKQRKGDHGGSIMQPTGNLLNTEVYTLPSSLSELAKMDERKVRNDLLFIHQFMKRDRELHQLRYGDKSKKKSKRKNMSSDEEEEGKEDEDFAGELEQLAKTKRQQQYQEEKKKKKLKDNDSEDDNSSDDFDYSDMEPSDLEDNILLSDDSDVEDDKRPVKQGKRNDFTEVELEKILLDDLSSDDEELETAVPAGNHKRERIEESFGGRKSKKGRMDPIEMFASADKFAHLLEGKEMSGRFFSKGDTSQKEIDWEEKRAFDLRSKDRRGNKDRRGSKDRRGGRTHNEEQRTSWGKVGRGRFGTGSRRGEGRGRFGTGSHRGEGRGSRGRSSQEGRNHGRFRFGTGSHRGEGRGGRGSRGRSSQEGRNHGRFSRPARGGSQRGRSRPSRGRGGVKQSRGGRGPRRGFSNQGRRGGF